MPRKVFTAGEVLAAADVNTYLMNQAVMTFAGTAARSSAIGSATEGMVTYLADTDTFQFWNGTAYASLAPATPTMEYLVIGGGGGGGRRAAGYAGGAGGAGGYRTNVSGQLSGGSVTAESPLPFVRGTAYRITVGAGGTGGTFDGDAGQIGNRSVLFSITSQGGGGSRLNASTDFSQGGCGGGASGGGPQVGGKGIVGEGFNGGNAITGNTGGGGGGGAGAQAPTVTTAAGAAGGAGLTSTITGSSVARGGGGGGGAYSGSGGTGGTGGGGNGSLNTTAGSGTANTGGGGGGSASGNGGAGGSGVVIFSVVTGTTVTFSGGVTQTNSTISGRQVYVVTATSTTSETVTFS
jgi:hypothetical protein